MNDPDAVLRWLEAAAKSAEEEFDRLMGVMPPDGDAAAARAGADGSVARGGTGAAGPGRAERRVGNRGGRTHAAH